ncbi:MAG: NAD-dependent epimerase/dehydratase family protein [Lactobacillus sp.]|jgi:uncharacterized protein YbjT (DUF2867 family)|nr:NAD-dependent epimerase/dehydratase family protein [Lactobacillus sp.]
MTTVVMLGGNGYVGRTVTEKWLEKDKTAVFYIVSRSGNNQLQNSNIHNIRADVTNYEEVVQALPNKMDYILDFVGAPDDDPQKLIARNERPAQVMQQIAETYQVKAMGFIGGKLGPKPFTKMKSQIIVDLQKSPIRLAYVEPTLIYGNGRQDKLTKMVLFLKFAGLFSKNLKPVQVNDVADELIHKMISV